MPAAQARIEPPSTDAEYLNNPKPAYPLLSQRLREQGKVQVRVLIGADGLALKAEISQTSGFQRLDQAALNTALKWRYRPGKRGGVPEAMWFIVPIEFTL
ncbi:energy transducer TonB [Ramlibacter sp.]|uniref:energy transducer TonB n=1 Tax=Ramlibacter sp. TaxID=1917967 RepID=UPI0030150F3D